MTTSYSLSKETPMLKKSILVLVTIVGLGAIASVVLKHLNES